MRDTKKALQWIVACLQKRKIPFQITGGLAARVYGATRRLSDIDIEVHDRDLTKLVPDVRSVITYGPRWYRDDHWNVLLMTVQKYGQRIDISGADSLKIFDPRTGRWNVMRSTLCRARLHLIFGIRVPVTSKTDLIAYEKVLARGVDVRDIEDLERKKKKSSCNQNDPVAGVVLCCGRKAIKRA